MEIDAKKLEAVLGAIGSDGPCADGNCTHCQVQEAIQKVPAYRKMLISILTHPLNVDPQDTLQPLHMSLVAGFILAWEYRDMTELEELNSLVDERPCK